MNKPSDQLRQATDYSFDELKRNAGDVARLPIELQTVVRVISATGVIGNGGLRYFFERGWQGTPVYDEFVSAFRTIGAHDIADSIQRIVQLFDFPDPHLDDARRHERYCELFDIDPLQVEFALQDLVDILEKTDALLETYVANHQTAFVKK
jgi:hypothetical protein